MRQIVLTIGFFVFVAPFGQLAAQPYFYDPPGAASGKGTTTTPSATPGGILIGPSGRKATAKELETKDESNEPGSGFSGPYSSPSYIPRFSGGMFQPRLTYKDIQQQKAEKAWRESMEFERRNTEIYKEIWTKEAVEATLRELRLDPFGEVDEIPANLRAGTDATGEKHATDEGNVDTGNQPDGTEILPLLPVVTPPTVPSKVEDEDVQRQKDEKERIARLSEEAAEQREAARQAFLDKCREAEKGAAFFELPENLRIPEQQLKAGSCNLFDGKTFFGWRVQNEGPYGGGRFFIDNQMICSDPEHPGLLYTTNQFGDATFQLEYQAEENAEVFLLVRTSPNPRDLHSSCYAIVLNSGDYHRSRGTILGRHLLSVEQLQKREREAKAATAADNIPPDKRWRKATAQFDGTMLRVVIDKDEAVTLVEAKPPGCGYLGILVTKGTAKFRNLIWTPGSSISLFDGVDSTAEWRHREAVKWAPTSAAFTLQLSGGPGVVETTRTFDNFVLQFEYNITHSFGRSGLFFRSTPREEQTGYEVAIQNMPTKEDRAGTVGVDVGSFRSAKQGRFLRTSDQQWNYLTVLAVDRHFQTWVNGVPVCEWTVPADRPLITSGTLQFLAPTDATNVQFRNIRYTPIQPRSERLRTFEDRNQTTYAELNEQRKAVDREKQLDEKMRKGP